MEISIMLAEGQTAAVVLELNDKLLRVQLVNQLNGKHRVWVWQRGAWRYTTDFSGRNHESKVHAVVLLPGVKFWKSRLRSDSVCNSRAIFQAIYDAFVLPKVRDHGFTCE
jgi:hypothetical protein